MYGSVAELRTNHLPQVETGASNDAILTDLLTVASNIVDGVLGFTFSAYGTAAAKDIYNRGQGTRLWLPAYEAASITSVASISGKGETGESTESITEYDAEESERPYYLYCNSGWSSGVWYRITAKWGYGTAPDEVVEVAYQIAVNLWGSRDHKQISDVVGVEGGGAVGYVRSLTNQQRMVLQNVRAKYMGIAHT